MLRWFVGYILIKSVNCSKNYRMDFLDISADKLTSRRRAHAASLRRRTPGTKETTSAPLFDLISRVTQKVNYSGEGRCLSEISTGVQVGRKCPVLWEQW